MDGTTSRTTRTVDGHRITLRNLYQALRYKVRFRKLDGAIKKPGPEAVPTPLDPVWDGQSHLGNVDQGTRNLLEETDQSKNSRLSVPGSRPEISQFYR